MRTLSFITTMIASIAYGRSARQGNPPTDARVSRYKSSGWSFSASSDSFSTLSHVYARSQLSVDPCQMKPDRHDLPAQRREAALTEGDP